MKKPSPMSLWTLIALGTLSCSTTPKVTGVHVTPTPISALQIHGHRGSRGTHPENSLPAFEEAVQAGATVLEMDLHLSSDGIPMLTHDSAIDRKLCRKSNGGKIKKTLRIRSLTAAQIQTYDCGKVKNPRFPEQKTIPNSPIPTFEQVLEYVSKNAPKIELNVETKMDEPRASENPNPKVFVEAVLALLAKYNMIPQTILQSFDFSTLKEAKKLEPKLRLSALFEFDKEFCQKTEDIGAQYASPDFNLVNLDRVRNCHEKGIKVAPWTVNGEAEWNKMIEYGVDGIITDYPRKLVTFLNSKK